MIDNISIKINEVYYMRGLHPKPVGQVSPSAGQKLDDFSLVAPEGGSREQDCWHLDLQAGSQRKRAAARAVNTGGRTLVKGTQPGLAESRYPSLSTPPQTHKYLPLATQMPVSRDCMKTGRSKKAR